MAGALVHSLIGKLAEIASQQVVKEASLVLNFTKDFQWLTKKLTNIRGYLKDADARCEQNDPVGSWFQDVQDIVFHAEDIVEECATEPLYATESCLCSCSQLAFEYKMGRRIRDLKERMKTVIEDANEPKLIYDVSHLGEGLIPSSSNPRGEEWKKSGFLDSNARSVALETKVQEISRVLEDPAHHVIAVVGMGGIGKTFLLQNVYSKLKKKFEIAIWLSISQTFSLKTLQSDIASYLKLNPAEEGRVSRVSEQRAAELIGESLQGKRFLIVLDDVWRVSGVENLIERLGIPTGDDCPWKIVMTSRSKEVCGIMNASYIYPMELLPVEASWDLFCLYAFPVCRPPVEVELVAEDIVKECGGLPLALKTVAASMANQTALGEWESKLRQLKEVSNREDPIMLILRLSYDSLPAHLKPCFLYFSFFAEDEEINGAYLINLWIAEGYIRGGENQWDVGVSYLNQLGNLCMVEVREYYKLEKFCKIHDLLLDLAILISKRNKCAFTVDEASASHPSGCRRILLAKKRIDDADLSPSLTRLQRPRFVRTLSLSQNQKIHIIPADLLSSMKLLRVIDLSSTKISTLPACFGNLRLLRVLNLFGTEIEVVPECIRNLKSLQYLDIRVQRLPPWISELTSLQHLQTGGNQKLPKKIQELKFLRVLRADEYLKLSAEENRFLSLKDIAGLVHLQLLEIEITRKIELHSIERGVLENLVDMRHLKIRCDVNGDGERNVATLPHVMKEMKNLEFLSLWRIGVSDCIFGFEKLRALHIVLFDCSEYPALEKLPNLEVLMLDNNIICRELPEGYGRSGAFPKLRILLISSFPALEELPILQGGAMPGLEELTVSDCGGLQRVPKGLQHLKKLKHLDFSCSGTNEFREKLKEGGMEWEIKEGNYSECFRTTAYSSGFFAALMEAKAFAYPPEWYKRMERKAKRTRPGMEKIIAFKSRSNHRKLHGTRG